MESLTQISFITILLIIFLILLFYIYFKLSIFLRRKTPISIPPSQYIDVDEGRIHYVQQGKGPDIVLLHGIGASVYTWRFLIPLLGKKNRVTAIDLFGFGRSNIDPSLDHGLDSQIERLHQLFIRLGIQKCFLVGSSMGGALALWYTYKFPQKVSKLALLAPAAHPQLVPFFAQYLTYFSKFLLHLVKPWTIAFIMNLVVHKKELITQESVEHYFFPYSNNHKAIEVFINASKVIADKRLLYIYSDLNLPTLILWGAKDKLIPLSQMKNINVKINGSQLEIHQKAGHHVMEDDPDWTAKHLVNFFTS